MKGTSRLMQSKQHRSGAHHPEDRWCLQMLCRPIRVTGLESLTVAKEHRGLHDHTGSWCRFYGCEEVRRDS